MRGTKAAILGLVAWGVLGMGGPAVAETITLRADRWCPYNCAPDSDKPGYMVEIAKAVFEPKGYTIDYQNLPWSRALDEVRAGRFDAAIGATPEEAPDFVLTASPLGMSTNVIGTRRGYGFRFTGVGSVKGHRLAAVQDYAYAPELDAWIAENAGKGDAVQLAAGDNVTTMNIRKLLAERVDLVLEDLNVLEYSLAAEGSAGLLELHEVASGAPLYIAFSPARPGSATLATMLEEGVQALRRSGELKRILDRYGLKDWGPMMVQAR